ncbi:MAG: radical SAM protein, partial [Magnetospirillum sp.]|nr:radical SAM protein [Magnetospirillum sp.]
NFRCVFCYQTDEALTRRANGHMGQMSLDTFKQVVDQIAGEVEAVSLASRGEPLVCRDIEGMLGYAAGKFLGLKINTNASLLDEQRAHAILSAEPNTVVFSADAADPELYAKLRVNGNFEKVAANIRRFAEIRRTHYPQSRTITRVSGVKFCEQQDFGVVDNFWHEFVDQVAFVSYNPWENAYQQPPNGITAPCSDLWRRTFVWWDGKVNPCDVDYRSTLAVGNVTETPLGTLWQGDAYGRLRHEHQQGRRQCLTPCGGCSVL